MDGVRLALRVVCVGPLVVLAACAGTEVEDDSVPFDMYDSPLVAGAFNDSGTGSPRMGPPEGADDSESSPAPIESSASTSEKSEPDTSAGSSRKTDANQTGPDQLQANQTGAEKTEAKPSDSDTESGASTPALATRRSADSESTDERDDENPREPASSSEKREETDSTSSAAAARKATADRAHEAAEGANRAGESDDDRPDSAAARYAAAIYELNDVAIPAAAHKSIPELYRTCRGEGALFQDGPPAAGDLAFFHNVRDANDDGRNNDWYTHVALVESVDSDGTVTLFGYRNGKVQRFVMNLERKGERRAEGTTINTRLREPADDDPPYTRYLAGELFAGYCSMLGDRSELVVVDNWEPGMDLERPE